MWRSQTNLLFICQNKRITFLQTTMNGFRKYFLLFLIVIGIRLQAEDALPPAPTGFTWQHLTPIKSAVLRPDGWFYKQSTKANTQGFYVSKEDIDKLGFFKTGLTLDCIRNISKITKLSPSLYAAQMADAAASKFPLLERSSSTQGPFKAIRFNYVSSSTNQEDIRICQLLIANDKTDTLFIVIFESPTSEWQESWKKGEVILKKLLIDDGI